MIKNFKAKKLLKPFLCGRTGPVKDLLDLISFHTKAICIQDMTKECDLFCMENTFLPLHVQIVFTRTTNCFFDVSGMIYLVSGVIEDVVEVYHWIIVD